MPTTSDVHSRGLCGPRGRCYIPGAADASRAAPPTVLASHARLHPGTVGGRFLMSLCRHGGRQRVRPRGLSINPRKLNRRKVRTLLLHPGQPDQSATIAPDLPAVKRILLLLDSAFPPVEDLLFYAMRPRAAGEQHARSHDRVGRSNAAATARSTASMPSALFKEAAKPPRLGALVAPASRQPSPPRKPLTRKGLSKRRLAVRPCAPPGRGSPRSRRAPRRARTPPAPGHHRRSRRSEAGPFG